MAHPISKAATTRGGHQGRPPASLSPPTARSLARRGCDPCDAWRPSAAVGVAFPTRDGACTATGGRRASGSCAVARSSCAAPLTSASPPAAPRAVTSVDCSPATETGAGSATGAASADGAGTAEGTGPAAGAVSAAGAEPTDGAGSGAGAEALAVGAADSTGGALACGSARRGAGAGRAGRNTSGSRYPCGSDVLRIPKYTYASGSVGSSDAPAEPTTEPSLTSEPRFTAIVSRWSSVTVVANGVWIEIVFPPVGTVPANATTPCAGARTVSPTVARMSMPRCCPAAYGWSWSKSKPRAT